MGITSKTGTTYWELGDEFTLVNMSISLSMQCQRGHRSPVSFQFPNADEITDTDPAHSTVSDCRGRNSMNTGIQNAQGEEHL